MRTLLRGHVNVVLALCTVLVALGVGVSMGVLLIRTDASYDYTLAVAPTLDQKLPLQYGVWPELSNADFFTDVHDDLLMQKANFVEANLTGMEMRVYIEGVEALRVPIKSKGKEGSWWETPSGLYRAEGKEKNHFSSFGQVNMPFSIPFQGNFFIHGWPYYEDGTPVSSTYSGGCIRLEDEYAKSVYDLVEVGMPILVYEESGTTTPFTYSLAVPEVAAQSYLVADIDNNFVLLAGSPASLVTTPTVAKLMTAVVASEHQNIEKMVVVDAAPDQGAKADRQLLGQTYSIYDLLFPLLLEDSDAAAAALAGYFGERRFVGLMESKAKALGLNNTTFSDAAGPAQGTVTNAEDTFVLLKYLHSNRHFILSMSANTTNIATYGASAFADLRPVHPLVGESTFVGGAAEARQEISSASGQDGIEASVVLAFASSSKGTVKPAATERDQISIIRIRFNGVERPVAIIVFDSPTPERDTEAMRSFVEQLYR